jgi:hypothetical protein
MKRIIITILFSLNIVFQVENGIAKLNIGTSANAQSAQQVANYLNGQNNGNIYTYNSSTNMVFQHNGSGGWPSIIHPNTVSIPGTWTWNGSPSGSGFTSWLNSLSAPLASALDNFLSSTGGNGSNGGGENGGGEEWPNNGWEPMPDGFGYDPTDPNAVDNIMYDPMFNPGNEMLLSPWDMDIFNNLGMYHDLYTGNFTVDCNNDVNGTAYTDSCGKCVGGNTGKVPCTKDCANIWGGGRYIDSCGICIDSIRKQPCDTSYKKIGDSLYSYLFKPQFADSLNKIMNGIDTASRERAIGLGQDSTNGNYKASGILYSPDSTSVLPVYRYQGIRIFKLIHTHPNFGYPCFSGVDFYGLSPFFSHPLYNQINSQYVIASDTTMYAMAIEDSLLYSNFISAFPYDSVKDGNNGFDPSKVIGQAYFSVYNHLAASQGLGGTLSDNEADDQAQSYILSKFNTGLVLYRKKKLETRFRKINTKASKDAAGNDVFTPYNCL